MISDWVFDSATELLVPNDRWRVTVLRVTFQDCPKETVRQPRTDHAEIRSLVRLYKKSSPSPPREIHPPETRRVHFVKPEPQPVLEIPSSTSKLRRFSHAETRRPSIKFATSTALYTPAKPTYGSSLESGKSLFISIQQNNF